MRAFRLAYDGRPYRGFQRQPDVPTIEGVLNDALGELGVGGPDGDVPPGYTAAGRTDAGVSAVAQTVAFECPAWCTPRAVDGRLPDGVHVWASVDVSDDFHATHDAARRVYSYHLPAPRPGGRDGNDPVLERARSAAERLSGEHDLHNLTPDDDGTMRELDVTVERDGDFLTLTVGSDGFPRHLVRRLATLVDAVARDEAPLERIDRVLARRPLDGPTGIPPAPPAGLVLVEVQYPGVTFEPDPIVVADARRAFEDVAWSARTAARSADRVLDGLG